MAVAANTPIELIEDVYAPLPERLAIGRRAPRPAAHLRREGPDQPPPRPRDRRARAGPQLHRPRPRPRRHAGRHRPDGAAPVHDRRPAPGRRAVHGALRPPHPGQVGAASSDLRAAIDTNDEVYDFLESVSAKYGDRLLEARLGHHPPGRARAVRLPRRDDDRHRQPHAQRRRPRHGRHRRGRCRRRRRDDRLPVQRALAQAHRRPPHRRARAAGRPPRTSSSRSPRSSPSRAAPAPSSSTSVPAPNSISCTGKATICNMGAEIGATTSLFAYDEAMARYLDATGREAIADAADAVAARPAGRRRGARRPRRATSTRSSRSTSPTSRRSSTVPTPPTGPARSSELGAEAAGRGLADGDQRRPRRLVHQLLLRGHHPRRRHRPPGRRQRPRRPRPRCSSPPAPSRSAPPSSATACSPTSRPSAPPCWPTPAARASASGSRTDVEEGDANAIVTSYNRNFPKRNDGLASTLAFVTSPETVVALALAGRLDFDPVTDTLTNAARRGGPPRGAGRRGAPGQGLRRPARAGFIAPPDDGRRRRGAGLARPPTGSSCSSRSPPGTARTSSSCPSS